MRLSKKKFNELLKEHKLILSLIGMSNVGKTYWAERLAKLGFEHISCDDLIEAELLSELKKFGYAGITDMSRWMGQPYDKRYKKNQQKYLNLERKVMKNFFSKIKNKNRKSNVVIDTTGSVVHCGSSICQELKKNTLVVCIEATNVMKKKMFKLYVKAPKPVVFGNIFMSKKGKSGRQTLETSYIRLLDYRHKLYSKYADVVLPYKYVPTTINTNKFINLIKKELL